VNSGSIDYRGALEAVERILNRGGDSDVVLQALLEALHSRGVSAAKVLFVEHQRLVEGPTAGGEAEGIAVPVVYEGSEIGRLELAVGDLAFAERVATLISPYVVGLGSFHSSEGEGSN
jgi:hypothetical protein